jgi:hypothetical protein
MKSGVTTKKPQKSAKVTPTDITTTPGATSQQKKVLTSI